MCQILVRPKSHSHLQNQMALSLKDVDALIDGGTVVQLEAMLSSGALSPNATTTTQMSVLARAIKVKRSEVAQLLVRFGARCEGHDGAGLPILALAVLYNMPPALLLAMIASGASISTKSIAPPYYSALHVSVLVACGSAPYGQSAVPLRTLLAAPRESDAELNATGAYNDTALFLAVKGSTPEVIGMLVDAGADVNVPSTQDDWPNAELGRCPSCRSIGPEHRCGRCRQVAYCSVACQTSHFKDHKRQCKANKVSADDKALLALRISPLELILVRGMHFNNDANVLNVVKKLLGAGAVATALSVGLATRASCAVLKLLLDAGAPPNMTDEELKAAHPLVNCQALWALAQDSSARPGQGEEAARLLLSAGADPNARHREDGKTVLMAAAKSGCHGIVRACLEHPDCDVNAASLGG